MSFPFPSETVNKIVPLKFWGIDLQFKLSHALFSSHKIDEGTMLLLKSLAQQKAVPETGRVLDAGCGVGPLAVSLKKKFPGLTVTAQDRLALACAFAEENARLNRVELDVVPGLLLEEQPGPWDLLVSNLPAKAGEPVLKDFLQRSLEVLAPDGLAAIVIVATLRAWAEEVLTEAGAEILFREESPQYGVFHYRKRTEREPASLDPLFPQTYLRGQMEWNAGKIALTQATFWGLPNFDALDYSLRVSLKLMEKAVWKRGVLLWEPGQGHLSNFVARFSPPTTQITLAGNDLLGLRAAAANLGRVERPPKDVISSAVLGGLSSLPARSFAGLVIQLHTEPEIPWTEETLRILLHLAAPLAPVLVAGTSTDLARFSENHRGLRILKDERYRGFRSVLFERQDAD